MKGIPNTLLWDFNASSLRNKQYLKDLDFIREHTAVDYLDISAREGVQLENLQQCHDVIAEMVEHAHKIGLKICLHLQPSSGFFNASVFGGDYDPAIDQVQLFPIPDPTRAEGLICDVELTADESGQATYTHTAKWGRAKIMPIGAEILRAYAFEKAGDGFYRPGSLIDVSDRVQIYDSRTASLSFDVDLGPQHAGKTVFMLVAQYYNYTETTAYKFSVHKKLLDSYADIPLDGFVMDEYGFLSLNTAAIMNGTEEAFRGRLYYHGMWEYYEETLNTDLHRLLLDMRYVPLGEARTRIRAINTYFDTLRVFPLAVETMVYDYAKKLYGEDIYMSCHNTFHNDLENDEIWHTACTWWDIPRQWGHTDENITFPVRTGIMLARQNPLMIDMYHTKEPEAHYRHMIEGAPFNCREFHHAYNDFFWGCSFTEPAFLKNIRILDEAIAHLNGFQREYPKMDLLILYGASAQNNWYPYEEERSVWDINGSLHILSQCDQIWKAGYRCALVPDYAVADGRITREGNRIAFNGYSFDHVLFLYPQYAKKETVSFLNEAIACGVSLAAVGRFDTDFDGDPAVLSVPRYNDFSLSILEDLGCPKRAISGGCEYRDGSFALVSDALLGEKTTDFAFTLDGVHYTGTHTGILAYRRGDAAIATAGSELFANGTPIPLSFF